MKRNGFTLAEVLITLAIIGVVAVMTIPNLMANTTGAQTATSFKKFVSTMEEVNQLSSAQYGFTFPEMTYYEDAVSSNDPTTGSFCAIMRALTSCKSCTKDNVTFKDGAEFHYTFTQGLLTGVYDANGNKGPNESGNVTGSTAVDNVNNKKDLEDLVNVTFDRNGWMETKDTLSEKIIHDKI